MSALLVSGLALLLAYGLRGSGSRLAAGRDARRRSATGSPAVVAVAVIVRSDGSTTELDDVFDLG